MLIMVGCVVWNAMDQKIPEVFDCEKLQLTTEKYGEFKAVVIGGDMVQTEARIDGSNKGIRWYAPIEGETPNDGYLAFSMSVTTTHPEVEPTVLVEEMVAQDEWESIGVTDWEVLE